MSKTKPVTITGSAAVLVSKYDRFDPANPIKSPAHSFSFIDPAQVKDGVLGNSYANSDMSWRLVGHAEIKITMLPTSDMLRSAVEGLKAQKTAVLATAQREANRIEGEIQKLLAITFEG